MSDTDRNFIPRYLLDSSDFKKVFLFDRKTKKHFEIGKLDSRAIVMALFDHGARVVEWDAAGVEVTVARAIESWGGIEIVWSGDA